LPYDAYKLIEDFICRCDDTRIGSKGALLASSLVTPSQKSMPTPFIHGGIVPARPDPMVVCCHGARLQGPCKRDGANCRAKLVESSTCVARSGSENSVRSWRRTAASPCRVLSIPPFNALIAGKILAVTGGRWKLRVDAARRRHIGE
jgi:hypothetical protein